MKKTLKSVALAGTLCGSLLNASFEFRTPLSAQWRGYFHWQLSSVADAWWYDNMPSQKERTTWDFHTWGVGYTRTASRAFFSECGNHNTRHTTSLSSLIFGAETFRGEQAFAGGTFANQSLPNQALLMNTNPFLGFAFISPRFDYNEQGAFMGIEFSRNFGKDDKLHAGGRISIPYKIIEIEQDSDYTLEETLADVISTQLIVEDENVVPSAKEYAMRFDFLNVLNFNTVTTPSNLNTVVPFVNYKPAPSAPDNSSITIGGVQVMGTTSSTAALGAYATESYSGALPSAPFRRLPSQVTVSLGADGEGADTETLFFKTGVTYSTELKNDRNAQGRLFIVPRAVALTGGQECCTITIKCKRKTH